MKAQITAAAPIALLAALALTIGVGSSSASASSTPDFCTYLESQSYQGSLQDLCLKFRAAGFTTTHLGGLQHVSRSDSGAIAVEQGEAHVIFEFVDYPNEAAMQVEWSADPGSTARPRGASPGQDDRPGYWNGSSVLVPYGDSNDPGLMATVGDMFLSLPSDTESSIAIVQPPHAGNANLLIQQSRPTLPWWLGVLWSVATGAALACGIAATLLMFNKLRRNLR